MNEFAFSTNNSTPKDVYIDTNNYDDREIPPILIPIDPDNHSQFGFCPIEHNPELKQTMENNDNIIKYEFTNKQSIQDRLLMINYAGNVLKKSDHKQLLNSIHKLSVSNCDFRYPVRDSILSTKNTKYGDWICNYNNCYEWNTYYRDNCKNCQMKRNQNIGPINPKPYTYDNYFYYTDNEYKKWKVRIQNLIDPLYDNIYI